MTILARPTPDERFDAKVLPPDPATGCWGWKRPHPRLGYGYFYNGTRSMLAHRFAFERYVGTIPEGSLIDHMCRNRACVNPEHLQLADRKTNGENTELSKANTSGVRGVTWDKVNHMWMAAVKHNYKLYWAGRHATLEEAEAAVIALRNELFTNNLADRIG